MDSKGFTLIEIILVIVLMGIAIPALVGGMSFIARSQVSPSGTTTAINLARDRMEKIVADKRNPAIPFASIDDVNYPPDVPISGYNRSVMIACVSPPALDTAVACPTNYRRVEVTVQTSGITSYVPDAVLVTLVTNY